MLITMCLDITPAKVHTGFICLLLGNLFFLLNHKWLEWIMDGGFVCAVYCVVACNVVSVQLGLAVFIFLGVQGDQSHIPLRVGQFLQQDTNFGRSFTLDSGG